MRKFSRLALTVLAGSLALAPTVAASEPIGPGNTTQQGTGEPDPEGNELYNLAENRSPRYVVETTADEVLREAGTDPVSFDECAQNHDINQAPYWFKNRYGICRHGTHTLRYFEIRNGQRVQVGYTVFLLTFIGVAEPDDNRMSFGVRVIHLQDGGTTHKDTTRYGFMMRCENDDSSRQSTCPVSPLAVEKSSRQWEDERGSAPALFMATGITTSVPVDQYEAEKRGYFEFNLVAYGVVDGVQDSGAMPEENFRCDEATYVGGSKCVFNGVISSLILDSNDPNYGESAQFIKDAQTNITLTKPGVPGKKVPGRFNEEPLHRLFHAYDTENDIAGSRRKVRRTCRLYYGVGYTIKDGVRQQCDEYPFATTRENAARVDENSPLTFAVKQINASHNERAGNIYGIWLRDDHLLDGDPFFVIIR